MNWQALDVASQVGLQMRTSTDGYLCVADFDADVGLISLYDT